jgi:hypothetical protein
MSIANGYGTPGISITKIDGTTVALTMPTRLPEVNKEDPNQVKVKNTSFDFEDIIDRVGFKPKWTISYENWIDGTDLLNLRHLLENLVVTITLTPHVDMPNRSFPVDLVSFGTYQRQGPDSDAVHVGVKMEFECTKVLDAIPFPQSNRSGQRLQDTGTDTIADRGADVFHFYL